MLYDVNESGTRWCARFPSNEMFLARAGDIAITPPIAHTQEGKEVCAQLLERFLMKQVYNGHIECVGVPDVDGNASRLQPPRPTAATREVNCFPESINRHLQDKLTIQSRAVTMKISRQPEIVSDHNSRQPPFVVDSEPSPIIMPTHSRSMTPTSSMLGCHGSTTSYIKVEADSEEGEVVG